MEVFDSYGEGLDGPNAQHSFINLIKECCACLIWSRLTLFNVPISSYLTVLKVDGVMSGVFFEEV